MHKIKLLTIAIILAVSLSLAGLSFKVVARPLAATAPTLGAVTSFAVLAASAVTNTGPSVLNGDLGISPGNASSISGFPPGIYGSLHAADAVALQAQNDATTAYNALASQPCTSDLTGQNLGGLTLTPGVYCFSSSAQLTGNLVLDAQGDPNAVWVFRMGSTLTTASSSSVTYINSGSVPVCNVFWDVGSSATLGTTTEFIGNILAVESITMTTHANLAGRAVARGAAVTLDTNTITPLVCAAPTETPTTTSTATLTETLTKTPTTTSTATPSKTPTKTPTTTSTATPSKTPTTTRTATLTKTPTTTSTTTLTKTPTTTRTATLTKTPTKTPTTTRTATLTKTPTTTLTPTLTETPSKTPTTTLTPTLTKTPKNTPTRTPTKKSTKKPEKKKSTNLPEVTGLPSTGGGAPIRNEDIPWSLVIAGGFSAIALVFGVRTFRRNYRPKQ